MEIKRYVKLTRNFPAIAIVSLLRLVECKHLTTTLSLQKFQEIPAVASRDITAWDGASIVRNDQRTKIL